MKRHTVVFELWARIHERASPPHNFRAALGAEFPLAVAVARFHKGRQAAVPCLLLRKLGSPEAFWEVYHPPCPNYPGHIVEAISSVERNIPPNCVSTFTCRRNLALGSNPYIWVYTVVSCVSATVLPVVLPTRRGSNE